MLLHVNKGRLVDLEDKDAVVGCKSVQFKIAL